MPKTVFAPGSVLNSSFCNAINNPVFVDVADDDGEIPRITNNDLSNTPGQIKPEWTGFRDELKVATVSGLSITWQGGTALLPNNTLQAIGTGSTTVGANATSFVFVSQAGSVTVALVLPLICLPLAQVVAGASITSIVDLRPRFRVQPRASAIKILGGTGEQGSYSLPSGSATFADGEYYFQDFTIGAAATLTISKAARIFVAGNALIQGTINVTTSSNGGTAGTASGAITAPAGGNPGSGFGGGGGASSVYNYVVSNVGSGGVAGFVYGSAGGAADGGSPGAGGAGGGGLIIEAGGTITVASGASILAKGANGGASAVASGTPRIAGSGGGSGGLILLKALINIVVAGTLDVRGGDGGAASGLTVFGGSGGGGGQCVLISPSVNTSGSSVLLSGGAGGTNSASPNSGGGSGGGFGGAGGNSGGGNVAGSVGTLVTRNFAPVG